MAIDLKRPQPMLLSDPEALRLARSVGRDPRLNLDGDPNTLTEQEWRQTINSGWFDAYTVAALERLAPMFGAPAAARPALAPTAAPAAQGAREAFVDLMALYDVDAKAAELGWRINATDQGGVDLDGKPLILTRREFDAGSPRVWDGTRAQEVLLEKLQKAMQAPPSFATEARRSLTTSTGAKLVVYGDGRRETARIESILGQLAREPKLRRVIEKTTIVVSPQGKGLETIPEGASLGPELAAQAEGIALHRAFGHQIAAPTLAIRNDSVMQWDLGVVHELVHLVEAEGGPELSQKIAAVWRDLTRNNTNLDYYSNSREMFAFMGQWYLAGYGDVIRQDSPALFKLLSENLGTTALQAQIGALPPADARAHVRKMLRGYRTGIWD